MAWQGSIINRLSEGSPLGTFSVGDGVTVTRWTDRDPGTVIATTAKSVTVQLDNWERTDTNGPSESQRYEYTPNPDGQKIVFRWSKRNGGRYHSEHGGLAQGRNRYYDFSF